MHQGYSFQWSVVTDHWPLLLAGAWIDLWVSLIGFVLACALGLIVAFGRLMTNPAVAGTAFAYVQVARGIPPYVLLLWVHFGLASLLGLSLSPIRCQGFPLPRIR